MKKIDISDELYNRTLEFKNVVEAAIDEDLEVDEFFPSIISLGIDSMLSDLIGNLESEILIKSFKQLGERYPKEVYGYITETMKEGAAVNERNRLRQKMGFRPQEDNEMQ